MKPDFLALAMVTLFLISCGKDTPQVKYDEYIPFGPVPALSGRYAGYRLTTDSTLYLVEGHSLWISTSTTNCDIWVDDTRISTVLDENRPNCDTQNGYFAKYRLMEIGEGGQKYGDAVTLFSYNLYEASNEFENFRGRYFKITDLHESYYDAISEATGRDVSTFFYCAGGSDCIEIVHSKSLLVD